MASIEARIEKLEVRMESKEKPSLIGRLTIKLSPFFGRHGFTLEKLGAPSPPPVPRECREPMAFSPPSASRRREIAHKTVLMAKVAASSRDARGKLAEQEGYRIIYRGDPHNAD